MGVRPRNFTSSRPRKRHSRRNFSKLALELLRCHDHPHTPELAGMERISDFHVPELFFHSTGRKSYPSLQMLFNADVS
jgi:hypothetical protein